MKLITPKLAFLLLFTILFSIPATGAVGMPEAPVVQEGKTISISGTVLDREGRPAAGAVVALEDENGKVRKVSANKSGKFVISGVIEGAVYIIYVDAASLGSVSEARSFLKGDEIVIQL